MAKARIRRVDPEPETETELSTNENAAGAEDVREQFDLEREMRQAVEIEDLLGRLNEENARVQVKEVKTTGLEVIVERVDITSVGDDLNEFVRTRYGPGRWRLFFEIKRANGKFEVYQTRNFNVHDDAPKGAYFRNRERERAEETASPDNSVMSKLLDKVKTEGGGSNEMMMLFFKSMQDQSNKTNEMMMTMMTTVVTAIAGINRGGGGANPQLDMLQMLKVFKELNGGSSASDPIALLKFARELSKDMRDKGDDEPGWLKMLEHALPLFMPQLGGAPAGYPPPATPINPPLPAPEMNFQPSTSTEGEEMLARFLPVKALANAILPRLLQGIESGAEPGDALDMFNNPLSGASLTDKQWDDLVVILKNDTWAMDLFDDEAKIASQRAWFDKLRELILKSDAETEEAG